MCVWNGDKFSLVGTRGMLFMFVLVCVMLLLDSVNVLLQYCDLALRIGVCH